MAGKGGGAWKVAYADFVTAMMAFFLVMWITAQSDKVKEAIAHHFNDPFAPLASEDEHEDAEHPKPTKFSAPARPSHEEEAEAGGGGRSLLLVSQGGDRTSIGTVVRFAEESAELDAAGKRHLEEFVPYLLGKPQRVEIRGHSARRPLSAECPFRDHWQLAYARCLTVMAELERLGVPRERLRLSQAAGNEPPAAQDTQYTDGGQARVEINLLNETASQTISAPAKARPAPAKEKRAPRRVTPTALQQKQRGEGQSGEDSKKSAEAEEKSEPKRAH